MRLCNRLVFVLLKPNNAICYAGYQLKVSYKQKRPFLYIGRSSRDRHGKEG
jgi:hypothetical protein